MDLLVNQKESAFKTTFQQVKTILKMHLKMQISAEKVLFDWLKCSPIPCPLSVYHAVCKTK